VLWEGQEGHLCDRRLQRHCFNLESQVGVWGHLTCAPYFKIEKLRSATRPIVVQNMLRI